MQPESKRIAIAIFSGALVGGLLALEISESFALGAYLWVLGAVVGGALSYMLYDFSHLRAGVARAYRKTIDHRLDFKGIGAVLGLFGAFIILFVSVFAVFRVVFMCMAISTPPGDFMQMIMASMVASFMLTMCFVYAMIECGSDFARGVNFTFWYLLKYGNLVVWAYWVPVLALRGAPKIMAFAKRAFVYIHSDERTLCGVDAAIGVVAGHFLGHSLVAVLLGAVVGALWGVVNYEIVSVRWLKLAPASARVRS